MYCIVNKGLYIYIIKQLNNTKMKQVEIRIQIMQLNKDLITYAYDTVKFESILCEIESLKRKLYVGQPQALKQIGL